MDLDTFLTTLYVIVDDWYKKQGWAKRCNGAQDRRCG